MNIALRKQKLKRLAAKLRRSNAPEDLKAEGIKALREMIADDDYLVSAVSGYTSDSSGGKLVNAFSWGSTRARRGLWDSLYVYTDLMAGNYLADVSPEGVKVGCQTIDWKQYDALQNAIKKSGYLRAKARV